MTAYITIDSMYCQFAELTRQWRQAPPFDYPCFAIERIYMEYFIRFLHYLDDYGAMPIGQLVSTELEDRLDKAFTAICHTLDRNRVNGDAIYTLMENRRFIFRRDKVIYNRSIAGKHPKGLGSTEWTTYNHWLMSVVLWQGYLASQEPGYDALPCITRDPYRSFCRAPLRLMLQDAFKPLWGMRMAYLEAGAPCFGDDYDSIVLTPCYDR